MSLGGLWSVGLAGWLSEGEALTELDPLTWVGLQFGWVSVALAWVGSTLSKLCISLLILSISSSKLMGCVGFIGGTKNGGFVKTASDAVTPFWLSELTFTSSSRISGGRVGDGPFGGMGGGNSHPTVVGKTCSWG